MQNLLVTIPRLKSQIEIFQSRSSSGEVWAWTPRIRKPRPQFFTISIGGPGRCFWRALLEARGNHVGGVMKSKISDGGPGRAAWRALC